MVLVDDRGLEMERTGKGVLICETPDGPKDIMCNDVLYAPEMKNWVISVSQITGREYKVSFEGDQGVLKLGKVFCVASRTKSVHELNCVELKELM